MQNPLVLTLVCVLISAPAHARSDCDKLACSEVKADIREVEAKMRLGYSRAQGEKYEVRLRKLKRKRNKICR